MYCCSVSLSASQVKGLSPGLLMGHGIIEMQHISSVLPHDTRSWLACTMIVWLQQMGAGLHAALV